MGKIRINEHNPLKEEESKVYVSFKDESKLWSDGGDLNHKMLASVFFGGDMEQYNNNLHLQRKNE